MSSWGVFVLVTMLRPMEAGRITMRELHLQRITAGSLSCEAQPQTPELKRLKQSFNAESAEGAELKSILRGLRVLRV